MARTMLNLPVTRYGVVEKPDQESDGARNVNEGVQPIDVSHQGWVCHEESLDRQLPEDVQLLLKFNDLESMSSCDMNCSLNNGHGRESPTELIDLYRRLDIHFNDGLAETETYPVNQSPIPCFNQKWKFVKNTTEEAMSKNGRVGCFYRPGEAEDA